MEKIYKRAKQEIFNNSKRIEDGLVNFIPFGLERFEEYVPGLQKKNYVIITANSGIGKTKVAKCLYVIRPVDFILSHPALGIRLKIFYFCLEESKERFIQSIYAYKLYERYGIRVPIKTLLAVNRRALPRDVREKLDSLDEYMERFEDIVEVVDHIRYPYGIYSHVEQYMEQNGTWTMKTVPYYDKDKKEWRNNEVHDFYTPTHADHYVEVVTDHVAKLYQPKGISLHETIGTFSSKYCCELRDKYQNSILNIQQQAADQEKKQFTYTGQSIITKLEPSLDGLGDNKMTQRDADEIIGVFAPTRYEIPEHRKYLITTLEDNYRSLIQLKARDGQPNTRIGVYFDGAVNHIEELPPAKDMTAEKYEYYLQKAGRSAQAPGETQQTFNFNS